VFRPTISARSGEHKFGIKVSGPIANIGVIADNVGADEALIAIPARVANGCARIVRQLSAADLHFKTIPESITC